MRTVLCLALMLVTLGIDLGATVETGSLSVSAVQARHHGRRHHKKHHKHHRSRRRKHR